MSGKLIFAPIPRLPENWWDDPESVWTVWDRKDYYLWGSNSTNMFLDQGVDLQGGGLASKNHGPSRGYAHDHYIGINTMEIGHMSDNDQMFKKLTQLIDQGNNIIVPIYDEAKLTPPTFKYSLGTGIGSNVYKWLDIQKHIFKNLINLSTNASSVEIPTGVYWPECSQPEPFPHHDIQSMEDIQSILDEVN